MLCVLCELQITYHHSVKDMCVALYVVANDPESCSRRDTIQQEEGHDRTPVTARLQPSARVDDLLAHPCLLALCTGQSNAHTCELFFVTHLNISTRLCQGHLEQESKETKQKLPWHRWLLS